MNGLKVDMYEFEEQPDEADLQNPWLEMEIPDVHWTKDIVLIENPILREREIEAVKKSNWKRIWVECQDRIRSAFSFWCRVWKIKTFKYKIDFLPSRDHRSSDRKWLRCPWEHIAPISFCTQKSFCSIHQFLHSGRILCHGLRSSIFFSQPCGLISKLKIYEILITIF